MRRAIGLTVFSGMLGVTLFGLIFTPVFYYAVDWFFSKVPAKDGADGKRRPWWPFARKSAVTKS